MSESAIVVEATINGEGGERESGWLTRLPRAKITLFSTGHKEVNWSRQELSR
jgi:hypothetical protein